MFQNLSTIKDLHNPLKKFDEIFDDLSSRFEHFDRRPLNNPDQDEFFDQRIQNPDFFSTEVPLRKKPAYLKN